MAWDTIYKCMVASQLKKSAACWGQFKKFADSYIYNPE